MEVEKQSEQPLNEQERLAKAENARLVAEARARGGIPGELDMNNPEDREFVAASQRVAAVDSLTRQIREAEKDASIDERSALAGIEGRRMSYKEATQEARGERLMQIPANDVQSRLEGTRRPEAVITPEEARKWASVDASKFGVIQGADLRHDAARAIAANMRENPHYGEAIEKSAPTVAAAARAAEAETIQRAETARAEAAAIEERKKKELAQAMTGIEANAAGARKQSAQENSLDVKRTGSEMERGEFIVPRKIQQAYTEVDGRFYAKGTQRMMFHDQGEKLATSTTDKEAIADMVAYARAKQWNDLKLTGSQEFRREVWMQAESQGIRTQGYTPRKEDLAALKELTAERATNTIKPIEERNKEKDPTKQVEAPRHDLNKNQATTAAAIEQNRTKHLTELQAKPGFEKFSMEDLNKISQFRAILEEREKYAPEAERDEAMASFDAAMQDPSKVRELPSLERKIAEREHNEHDKGLKREHGEPEHTL